MAHVKPPAFFRGLVTSFLHGSRTGERFLGLLTEFPGWVSGILRALNAHRGIPILGQRFPPLSEAVTA